MKYSIEFDSETNKTAFYVDGNPVSADSFSIGKYNYIDCNGQSQEQIYLSYGIKADQNSTYSYNFSYDSKTDETTQISPNYNMAKEMGKVAKAAVNSEKLAKAIAGKSPVTVIDMGKRREDLVKGPLTQEEKDMIHNCN